MLNFIKTTKKFANTLLSIGKFFYYKIEINRVFLKI
jgi:hypothetical protein